jgi:hypothetical protein
MSLYQCQNCGCVENTASGHYWSRDQRHFNWVGIEDRAGKKLCSACGPVAFASGEPTRLGRWHGRFERVFLPKDMFRTNHEGNLEHIETGETDYSKYRIEGSDDA